MDRIVMKFRAHFVLSMLSLLCCAALLSAETSVSQPLLLKDINEAEGSDEHPRDVVPFDSERVAFLYDDGYVALSDGSPEGTSIAVRTGGRDARTLVPLASGKALFVIRGSLGRSELWMTDGTQFGTTPLAEISPSREQIVVNDETAYMLTEGRGASCELWRSDGTLGGTKRQLSLPASFTTCPSRLGMLNSRFYFGGNEGLWRSDGTPEGTAVIAPGVGTVLQFANVGNRLLVASGENGNQRILSATESGVSVVKELSFVSLGATVESKFLVVGAAAFFVVGPFELQLWGTNGTPEGTRRVASEQLISPILAREGSSGFYFVASDSASPHTLGASVIRRMNMSTGNSIALSSTRAESERISQLLPLGKDLLYVVPSSVGRELWKYDATTGQSVVLKDIFPGPGSSDPELMLSYLDRAWFVASSPATGRELWASDGSVARTREVANLAPDGTGSSDPSRAVALGPLAFFAARDTARRVGLWKTNGTANGTELFLPSAENFSGLAFGERLYFKGRTSELWSTDGLTVTREAATECTPLRAILGKIYCNDIVHTSFDPLTGRTERLGVTGTMFDAIDSVWIAGNSVLLQSDGTAEGTRTLSSAPSSGHQTRDAWMGGRAFRFVGSSLYVSDGGREGYRLVVSDLPPANMVVATSQRVFFTAGSEELWVTDGSVGGTLQLLPERSVSDISDVAILGNVLYLAGTDSRGRELWRSDGTKAGTTLVTDLNPGEFYSSPRSLVAIDGFLYFNASTQSTGTELWRFEPASGSVRLIEIEPGTQGSNPSLLSPMNGGVIFSANTRDDGEEPWFLPPADSPSISIDDASSREGGNASLRVSLSRPTTRSVAVTYRSVPYTSTAGVDYAAIEGSLEFEPGETVKQLVVPIHSDAEAEPYEAFSIVLDSSDRLHRSVATVLIPSNELPSTVDLETALVPVSYGKLRIRIRNNSQIAATDVALSQVATRNVFSVGEPSCMSPAQNPGGHCTIRTLNPGESIDVSVHAQTGYPVDDAPESSSTLTVTAFPRDVDPNPADNVISLLGREYSLLFMDGLFVPVGGQRMGYVWRRYGETVANLVSSDTSIASVPEQVVFASGQDWASFPIRAAGKSGSVKITATYGSGIPTSLIIPVEDATTPARTAAPVNIRVENGGIVGDPLVIRVDVGFAGSRDPLPQGEVVLRDGIEEIARAQLGGGSTRFRLARPVGDYSFTASYEGDDRNLPGTSNRVYVWITRAKPIFQFTSPSSGRAGQPASVTFQILGGRDLVPTGSIELLDPSGFVARAGTAPGTAPGEAVAQIDVPPLIEGVHLLEARYSGDENFEAATLNIDLDLLDIQRRRGVRR